MNMKCDKKREREECVCVNEGKEARGVCIVGSVVPGAARFGKEGQSLARTGTKIGNRESWRGRGDVEAPTIIK